MDETEAIIKVLEACANLLLRMAVDGHADIGTELFAVSSDLNRAAKRLHDALEERGGDAPIPYTA